MKPRIGIFGRMNVGKSSLMNLLSGGDTAIVSPQAGTTTDPVRRALELLDFGPVVLIDTPGFDDLSDLGHQRTQKTINTLNEVDLVLFIAQNEDLDQAEEEFLAQSDKPRIIIRKPFLINILDQIKDQLRSDIPEPDFFGGRLHASDIVILVCPIDSEAPKGKLIMPQITAIRSALDLGAVAVVVQPSELAQTIDRVSNVKLVVTDSQAFGIVSAIVPHTIELTSFSILLSELKGDVKTYTRGLDTIGELQNWDRILLIEHCTHQTSCQDIARVKIPHLMEQYTGKKLSFTVISGRDPLPSDLASYSLAIQCGGCISTRGAIISRIEQCRAINLPITNYGMLLRKVQKPQNDNKSEPDVD